jgi:hypothetical protein
MGDFKRSQKNQIFFLLNKLLTDAGKFCMKIVHWPVKNVVINFGVGHHNHFLTGLKGEKNLISMNIFIFTYRMLCRELSKN